MLKISYVSTYLPTRCGIATYTHFLSHSLLNNPDVKVFIIAERGARPVVDHNFQCLPCFTRRGAYGDEILPMIEKLAPDVVHFQWVADIFGIGERFLDLLRRLETRACKKVLTMHTVHTLETVDYAGTDVNIEDYHCRIGDLVNKIIVHHDNSMKKILIREGVGEEKIEVIPHGTRLLERKDPREAKEKLGFPRDSQIILSFGFINQLKNVQVLIEAFRLVLEKISSAYLFIAGCPSQGEEEYLSLVKEEAQKLKIIDHIKLSESFIPEDEVPFVLSAADVIVYPYHQTYGSASGTVHLGIGAGKPIVCSRIRKFEEVGKEISDELLVIPNDTEDLARVMIRILTDPQFTDFITNRVRAYAARTSWEKIGRRHLELYRSIME